MGGDGGQKNRNRRQRAENERRAREYERISAENQRRTRAVTYDNDLANARQTAGYEASRAVTERRANAIRTSGSLLTDFQRQEKIRLLEAKKGVGQVDASNMLISDKDRKEALDLINKPPEYWEALREQAYLEASQGATSRYGDDRDFYINTGGQRREGNAVGSTFSLGEPAVSTPPIERNVSGRARGIVPALFHQNSRGVNVFSGPSFSNPHNNNNLFSLLGGR